MTKLLIDRAVAEQALHVATGAGYPVALIAALRAALAEPVQEPVQEPVMFNGLTEAETNASASVAGLTKQAEPVQDTDCHAQGICQRSGYGIGQKAEPGQEPVPDRLEQLRAFCKWERVNSPHPDGLPHVAEWALREIDRLRAALAEPVQEPDNGGKTGWPPGLLQDDCRGLSKWLASRPDARQRLREALAEPVQEPDLWGAGYEAGYQAGIAERPAKPVARPLREGEVMGAYMDFDHNIANKSWSNAEYLIRFGLFISECTVTPPAPDPALVAALAEPVQEPAIPWGKAIGAEQKRGCRLCGIGAAPNTAMGYVCPRMDCPTRVTCGVAA